MRLAIALALFLGVLDLTYSAPHANSEALLQELQNALNEKETSIQQQEKKETLAVLCEPMATGFARVPTSQTQSSNEMVRAQEPVSIGLGIAGLLVGLTGLGLQVADRVEGEEQSKNEAILQEIKNLLSQGKETKSTQNSNEMVRAQGSFLKGLDLALGGGVVVGWPPVGWPPVGWPFIQGSNEQSKKEVILQEIKKLLSQEKETKSTPLTDQKRNVANVPLTEMLCTPVKVERTDKLAGGSSALRVRTLQ